MRSFGVYSIKYEELCGAFEGGGGGGGPERKGIPLRFWTGGCLTSFTRLQFGKLFSYDSKALCRPVS